MDSSRIKTIVSLNQEEIKLFFETFEIFEQEGQLIVKNIISNDKTKIIVENLIKRSFIKESEIFVS